ncbi:MAG: diguanylate cyclase [Cryobacterium sp.]|nr:diguanylate cyclase [Oligoflexia bacterium]
MQFNVLLLGKDTKQTEVYGTLIRDMVECHIDVMSQIENAVNWIIRVRYHLVVIDLPYPSELVERIKRLHPESSVIVVSDDATIEEAVNMIRNGAEDYLRKPIHLDTFRLAVRRGIDRKTLFEEDGVYSRYLNLVNSCQMISASIDETRIFAIVRSYLSRELQSSQSCVISFGSKGEMVVEDSDQGSDNGMTEIFEIASKSAALPGGLQEPQVSAFVERTALTPSVFAFQFQCIGNRTYYFLALSPKKPEPFGEFEGRLKILRAQIDVTGQNIVRYRSVQEMAYVDDVTGLHNTRYLSTVLDREIEKSKSASSSFVVLFIDADKFKHVNDQHGHVHGSKLLSELGQKLKAYVRDADAIVRYGGDEFVAILTPCDLPMGKLVAERIRKSVENSEFLKDDGLKLKITISIGVAVFPDHANTKEDIIDQADHAMYVAKKESRNCVYVAEVKKPDA